MLIFVRIQGIRFQSTLPVGERPRAGSAPVTGSRFQSTLPVGGATQTARRPFRLIQISIHAPRGGSDSGVFQLVPVNLISIHAPRGGSDSSKFSPRRNTKHFNPRSPWGERLDPVPVPPAFFGFQSTLPVGGATPCQRRFFFQDWISIHAPRGGSDPLPPSSGAGERISIHAPRGGSDVLRTAAYSFASISIHAPRGGSDDSSQETPTRSWVFQSTLPVGGATPPFGFLFTALINFNPRSPWGERLQIC